MMKMSIFNIKTLFYFILVSFSVIFSSCDNENKNPIPVVSVDIYLENIDFESQYYDLRTIGGYIYITGGVNGIIVYKSGEDEYRAYERTCPYDPDCGKVFVDGANFNAVDSLCCHSEFSLLLDGAVTQGPSKFPLRAYSCIYNKNTHVLHITN